MKEPAPELVKLGITPGIIARKKLIAHAEAAELELAETGADGREHLLTPAAAAAWRRMKAAAAAEGVDIFIVSAYRSIARQVEIFRRKLDSGLSIEQILAVSAPPGYSEHHTGRAVDVSTPRVRPLEVEFEQTDAFRWLRANAAAFGYTLSYPADNPHGYLYEPWHWCHTRG